VGGNATTGRLFGVALENVKTRKANAAPKGNCLRRRRVEAMFDKLLKSAVALVIETPVAVIADAITLGGALNNTREPYTATALKKVVRNIQEATDT